MHIHRLVGSLAVGLLSCSVFAHAAPTEISCEEKGRLAYVVAQARDKKVDLGTTLLQVQKAYAPSNGDTQVILNLLVMRIYKYGYISPADEQQRTLINCTVGMNLYR